MIKTINKGDRQIISAVVTITRSQLDQFMCSIYLVYERVYDAPYESSPRPCDDLILREIKRSIQQARAIAFLVPLPTHPRKHSIQKYHSSPQTLFPCLQRPCSYFQTLLRINRPMFHWL